MIDHNLTYDELQKEYLKTRDSNILGKMYIVCKQLQTNYINNYCKQKKISFSYDELEDKIEISTLYVIEKYLKDKNFKVDRLSAYAYFGFLKAMFKDTEKEIKTIRFDDAYTQDDNDEGNEYDY